MKRSAQAVGGTAARTVTVTRAATAAALVAGCSAGDAPLVRDDWIEGDAMPRPLTDQPGDAARGLAVFLDQDLGHCVLCHAVDGLDAPFQGNLAPNLAGVADRLDEGQIRLQIADARRVMPDTIMPSYYRTDGLYRVAAEHRGQPVLSAQDVEDIVAYLMTQTLDGG